MKLIQSPNANINYLARIVDISEFQPHPNPKVNRMKVCTIPGTLLHVLVSIDSEPGLYVYFPAGSIINPNFLSYANLYRHSQFNSDSTKSGFFEDNGRVKAINLQGYSSEGFVIQFDIFNNFLVSSINKSLENAVSGTEFDSVDDGGKTFWVNKKYIIKQQNVVSRSRVSQNNKKLRGMDRLIEGQFRFHYDTINIAKCPFVIQPDDLIHLSSKWHGTSGISANVLCKRPFKWYERLFNLFVPKESKIRNIIYDKLWASRTVIKNQYYNNNVSEGFYGVDVWKYAHDVISPDLSPGMTVYYEIVGFTPNGKYIQKDYDYGFECPIDEQHYYYGKNFGIKIYRITLTDINGNVVEFSTQQVRQWCETFGYEAVDQFYYGYAKDLYPDLDPENHWHENFWERLANDKRFYMEMNSPDCQNKVPHEGIVIKKENGRSEAWKLKCFKFLNKEQSETEANIEDNA